MEEIEDSGNSDLAVETAIWKVKQKKILHSEQSTWREFPNCAIEQQVWKLKISGDWRKKLWINYFHEAEFPLV